MAYTHHSWWQVYNSNWSKPFRETNYNPEIFFRKISRPTLGNSSFKILFFDFGYQHESNGQIQELSRSWDRIFIRSLINSGNFYVKLSMWYRLPEDSKFDDNPDIHKYFGYGSIELSYRYLNSLFEIKYIPGETYHSTELAYSYPISKRFRLYTKYFSGFGNSLADYNVKNDRYSIGFALPSPLTSILR